MLVIPVFIPHWGCPHQCSFCNQQSIAGVEYSPSSLSSFETSFHQTIENYLLYKGNRSRVELAFFGGNFLGLSRKLIVRLLDLAQPYLDRGMIHGLRCSTRPDTITGQTLGLLENRCVSLVELGVQSMDDEVLAQCLRGHSRQDSLVALDCLARYGIRAGVQVMAGLPGESREGFLTGVRELAKSRPATARIYPLVVLAKSPLAAQYKEGRYRPLNLAEAVEWARHAYEIFSQAGVKVIRMGLQASDMLSDPETILAGPYHPAFGHLVFSSLLFQKIVRAIKDWLAINACICSGQRICLLVHPRSESRARGDKNTNILRLRTMFPNLVFSFATDPHMDTDEVRAVSG